MTKWYDDLVGEFEQLANPKQAKLLQRFFKTGKGEYGEGDVFLGIKVPVQRKVAKKYTYVDMDVIDKLLKSKVHEHRLTALVILINKYKKADEKERKVIFDFYLSHAKRINNWDLVDISCHKIVGDYLLDKPRKVLYKLAKSKNLWERRIAIVSTALFIHKKDYEDTIKISEMLLRDEHDLIHKAVGWMLREVGKRDKKTEKKFLDKYHKKMPRTMLRYAIEKFSEKERKLYMKR